LLEDTVTIQFKFKVGLPLSMQLSRYPLPGYGVMISQPPCQGYCWHCDTVSMCGWERWSSTWLLQSWYKGLCITNFLAMTLSLILKLQVICPSPSDSEEVWL
jgi:hypothetical protein